MTTKHTPGPWKADGIRLGEGYETAYVKTDRPWPNEMLICKLATFPPDNGEMDLGEHITAANAALIAAAPELLAACQKDAERIQHLCRMVNDFAAKLGLGKKVNADDWDDDAKAAIAKATNQTAAAPSGGGKAGHSGNG